MHSNINKQDPMEKKSIPKLVEPLFLIFLNGETYKIGLLVLLNVEEEPRLFTENVC